MKQITVKHVEDDKQNDHHHPIAWKIKFHVHNLLISFLVRKINVASKNILNSDNSNNMIIIKEQKPRN